jgi:hypothetical protein
MALSPVNLEPEIRKLSLAFAISVTESNARTHLTRTLWLSGIALGCRLASLDVLTIASLTLATREFVPGCMDILKARLLRRAFGNVDCG